MKQLFNKFFIIIFLLFLFGTIKSYSQNAISISDNIANTIKNGNARELASYFQSNIELTVLENDGTYSKSQAEIIMKDFFSKYPPSNFTINHKGSSNDLTQFFIGSYSTSNRQNYRIYFLLKSSSDKILIQQLQIQE